MTTSIMNSSTANTVYHYYRRRLSEGDGRGPKLPPSELERLRLRRFDSVSGSVSSKMLSQPFSDRVRSVAVLRCVAHSPPQLAERLRLFIFRGGLSIPVGAPGGPMSHTTADRPPTAERWPRAGRRVADAPSHGGPAAGAGAEAAGRVPRDRTNLQVVTSRLPSTRTPHTHIPPWLHPLALRS